jgi:beta-D-xylosidase 4
MHIIVSVAATPLRVVPCSSWSGDTASDGWVITSATNGSATFEVRNGKSCLEAAATTTPSVEACNGGAAQQWRNFSQGADGWQFQSASDPAGRCLMVASTSYSLGPGLLLDSCTQARGTTYHYGPPLIKSQQWSVEPAKSGGSAIRTHGGGCCGDIFQTRPVCLALDRYPSCADTPSMGAWCDMSASASARSSALLAAMTLEEKASNMDSHNFGVPRLGVPPNLFSEALHGFVGGCGKAVGGNTGCPTSFPQVISMGASFNRTLWSAVGTAVSDEVRGLYSQQPDIGFEAALFLWAPNINPFRDPRWGRGQEVVSEDPFVCAEYAAHYIQGLQQITTAPDGRRFLKTVATAKHFFDYDLEGGPPVGPSTTKRTHIDVNVTARDQVEFFSVPFRAAVERGNTQSVMCSYNAVDGTPACLSDAMINGKMRSEWGFEGFVTSDCDAISDEATRDYIVRKFNGSLAVQAQQALRGGTDLNCGALYGEQNVGAVRSGLIHEAELDTALGRIWQKAFELGVVDAGREGNPNPYARLGAEAVDTPASRKLALEAALQGVVLLQNERMAGGEPRLPLSGFLDGSLTNLALIGPHANGSLIFLGGPNYHGDNQLVYENTPPLRARAHLPTTVRVTLEHGCDVASDDRSGFAAAEAAAAAADAVVLFLGLDQTIENEGRDRASLELPGVQAELAQAVATAAKAPVVVVLVNGGPLAVGALREDAKVGAIVEAFFPGQFAAEAIIQLLLGHASPSGLLPVTVYDNKFVSRRPIWNLHLRDAGGVTYRYYEGTPLWPFGFGLSYASFSFRGNASAVLHTTVAAAKTQPLCLDVHVVNERGPASDVVVLGFVSSEHTDAPRNGKLADFVREGAVKAGEVRLVKLCIGAALPLVDAQGEERVLPGEYTVRVGVKGGVGGAGAGSVIGMVVVGAS